MRVTDQTKTIDITLRNESLSNDNARLIVINETSGADVYDKPVNIDKFSYYYQINDNQGFNFTDKENYIVEVYINQELEFRATAYCINEVPKVYNQQKRINTNNEYITI